MPSRPPIKEFRNAYHFLSNFYAHPVIYGKLIYPTSEHAYQAAKTDDARWREWIRQAETPSLAKRLGKTVPMSPGFEQRKVQVMKDILVVKFGDILLRSMLLATGSRELIEGNWWHDTFWGVCNGVGENHLGKILMEIRKEIRELYAS